MEKLPKKTFWALDLRLLTNRIARYRAPA